MSEIVVSIARVNTRECAVHCCPNGANLGQLMCRIHWRMVPKPLQHHVYQTWNAFSRARRGKSPGNDVLSATAKAYRAAAAEAVRVVTETKQAGARP